MNNSSVTNSHGQNCSRAVSTLFISLMSVISVAAIVGNFLVTAAFLKTSSLRTSTNYYIVNMTTSDLVCWCFNWPLYATEGMLTRKQFIAGPSAVVACKLGMYFRGVSQVVSVLSLVLIAVDRYFAIVFPLKATLFNGKRARITLLLLTWIIPLLTGIPYFIYTGIVEVDGYNFCRTLWNTLFNTIFNLAGFVVFYCTPLISMIILYSRIVKTLRKGRAILDLMKEKRERQRQKITKIGVLMVIAFFVCWTPLCVYLFLKLFKPHLFLQDHCQTMVALFFYVFPSLSTAINPIILFSFSTNYRNALKTLICKSRCFYRGKPLLRRLHLSRCGSTQATRPSQEDISEFSRQRRDDGTSLVLHHLQRRSRQISPWISP
ncbi:galanin receptor 2a-like isoform X1 [Montipora capricornis]|uniref:galanin receptor 2a-like isoform X1 n=1 Tax=Montipora capricornis TaxID=246305 RepID=UPI0035F201FB